jgi:antitoxin (DNA-binding transcriptional repressor) of toxin-antitoxin stability system
MICGFLVTRGQESYNSYVNSIKIADLKNNLSRHLARVRQGSELTVLDRDTPIARIVPFAPRVGRGDRGTRTGAARNAETRARLEELQRLGIIGAGDPEGLVAWVRSHEPVKLPKGTPSAVDLLIQMRRESKR